MSKLYFLRDTRSVVGNSASWWAINDKGYTCDIRMAKIFTEKEIQEEYDRPTDRAHLISDVLPLVQHHIDMQDLNARPKRKRTWILDAIADRMKK